MILVRAGITVDIPLLIQFSTHGFDVYSMKCRMIPYAANATMDVEPVLRVTNAKGFEITGKVMIDLQCTQNSKSEDYLPVFTLVTNRFYVAGKLKVEEGFWLSIKNG